MENLARTHNLGCSKCKHKGWIISPIGPYSAATLCECLGKCQRCGGTGLEISTTGGGYNYIKPCRQCGVVRRNARLYNAAGIPAKYHNVTEVHSFQPKGRHLQQAASYVKEFVKNYPNMRGFLLMGGSGLGKTHLAIAAISELTLERGVQCIFKDFFYLLSELKDAYSQGVSENEVIQPLIESEILVIDELGKGKSSEWELNILDQLISKRYNASKITLATTNYISSGYENTQGRDVLEERVGERIASRLSEMCEFLLLRGEDYRRKGASKEK